MKTVNNAADENQVKSAKKDEKWKERQIEDDLKHLLKSPHFRRYVWRYLGVAGVFENSFTGNNTTFFNEGKRNIGNKIMSEICEIAPDAFVLMMQEANKEKEK